jgi:hypothetical protein
MFLGLVGAHQCRNDAFKPKRDAVSTFSENFYEIGPRNPVGSGETCRPCARGIALECGSPRRPPPL